MGRRSARLSVCPHEREILCSRRDCEDNYAAGLSAALLAVNGFAAMRILEGLIPGAVTAGDSLQRRRVLKAAGFF